MTPNQYTPEEPISSIATALAPAALGIVRVSGKNCIELVSKVFSRPKALLEAAGNTLVYGWINDIGGESLPLSASTVVSTSSTTAFSATPSPRGSSPKTPANAVLDTKLQAQAEQTYVQVSSAACASPQRPGFDNERMNAVSASKLQAQAESTDVKNSAEACASPQRPARIDEVMLAVYRAPKSFTGEDMVEIFCHGGPAVVTAIQNLMLKIGFRQANRGEYTFRAYINGKTDLTKAEAIKEIIDSHTDVSRSHAAGRLSGSLYKEIDSIKKLIVDTLAAIEVEIEYPEDEETIADSFDRKDIEEAINRLQSLVDSWKSEKLYQDGARVVLAGRTNAGKSSLFNAILKEERAIVSDIEGTTRDWLESWASINGIPVRLFDTAGLRQTDDVIEAKGVEISRNLAHDADVVLYLVDGTGGLNEEDKAFIENCREPLVVVFTKCDLPVEENGSGVLGDAKNDVQPSGKDTATINTNVPLGEGVAENAASAAVAARGAQASAKFFTSVDSACACSFENETAFMRTSSPPGSVKISSKTGSGMAELYAQITKILTSGTTTEREQAGLGSARQKEAVSEALECTKHALVSADDNYTLDAVVQDLEDALDALGEVTGDVTPDDVLGSIFANFCVGK